MCTNLWVNLKRINCCNDGPNVNWNVLDLLDDKLVSDNFAKNINIGSCAQHTVPGSLKNGFQKSTWISC